MSCSCGKCHCEICGNQMVNYQELESENQNLKEQIKVLKEALEFYDGVHRLNWAIDLSLPPRLAKETLAKLEQMEKINS